MIHKKQFTKNPIRRKHGKKSHETYIKRLKEDMLKNNQLSTLSLAGSPTPSTGSSQVKL